jgi:hypothetical protein
MSITIILSKPVSEIIELVRAGKIPGLSHLTNSDPSSLWKDAIKCSGHNTTGWTEAPNMMTFWGDANTRPLVTALNTAGIRILDTF